MVYTRAAKNGKWGEIFASRLLRSKGHELVAANFRVRGGEIDLVSVCGSCCVFTEVKTRSKGSIAEPREFIGREKQRRIVYAAKSYLKQNNITLQPRFDVIEVYLDDSGVPPEVININHIPDAFTCNDEIF